MRNIKKQTKPESAENPTQPVGRTQTLSLTGFITSFIEPIIAIVLGHVALKNYKKEQDQTWKGFATASLILGYVGLVIRIKLAALFTILLILSAAAEKNDHDMENHWGGKTVTQYDKGYHHKMFQ